MLSKIACLNRWKVTNGCTCMLFSTVSSNCLPEKMQSRIGCICTLFQMFSKIACLNRWKVALIAFEQFQFSQIYFMKDYMMGPLQMPKIMSSYEADRLLC